MRDGKVAMASDGQVTVGDATVLKHRAKKVRRLAGGTVICGFAGSVADAQALTDRLESKLEGFNGNLKRAAVEFAKDWRTDKILRQLNAMMIAADREGLLVLSGDGNVIEPDDGIAGIGSGGPYAVAAARAMLLESTLPAEEIARKSLEIAADLCVFTNKEITIEVL